MSESKTLFTLPINKIEYKDIELFCSQCIPENSRLDYKMELKKDITKTIAAMANTDGGIILIGITEEKEQGGARSLPGLIVGLEPKKNPKQSIVNLCYTALQPVYCPEIINFYGISDSLDILVRSLRGLVY